jgi:ABC-2 type transport system ATP-binding protein
MTNSAETNSADVAIEVDDLKKTYRDGFFFNKRVVALRGVSFSVKRGETFGLLGPNGAGKTTLIKVLLGMVRGSGGSASLLGRPVGDLRSRRRVGFLPESHRFAQHHTGASALAFCGGLGGLSRSEIRRRMPDLLKLVGLERWADTPVRKYSKGMQQRLGLAQAILHEPELLILDEPTDGVDPIGRKEMRDLIVGLKRKGTTVFINSHLLQEVELVCDRVAIVHQGELRCVGRTDELTAADKELTFVVVAQEAKIREALYGVVVGPVTMIDAERSSFIAELPDQAAVDRCVDALRRAGVSLVSMAERRRTLEDAFLDVIGSIGKPAVVADVVDAERLP